MRTESFSYKQICLLCTYNCKRKETELMSVEFKSINEEMFSCSISHKKFLKIKKLNCFKVIINDYISKFVTLTSRNISYTI